MHPFWSILIGLISIVIYFFLIRVSIPLETISDAAILYKKTEFPRDYIFKPPIWGTLNSGHYFGLKLSSPETIETSLIWFKNRLNNQRMLDMRHLCNQGDGLRTYSWLRHNFYSFGEQTIIDQELELETSYVIDKNDPFSWESQVTIKSNKNHSEPSIVSLVKYLTIDDVNEHLDITKATTGFKNTHEELFTIRSFANQFGNYTYDISLTSSNDKFVHGSYCKGNYQKNLLSVTDFLHQNMVAIKLNNDVQFVLSSRLQKSHVDKEETNNNFVAYQMILKTPASFRVRFRRQSSNLFQTEYEKSLKLLRKKFDEKFEKTFKFETTESDKERYYRFGKLALSNMVGGVGYFYGYSLIKSSAEKDNAVIPYGPIQLLTAVPSRSFFPRGFLWDEGFHNILLSEWEPSISENIILSWFDIMNKKGWIPREVILGPESTRRVPQEFVVQDIANANPPTMFLAIERMMDSGVMKIDWLLKIYPRLLKWYDWFNTTQSGPLPDTYRWRGRDELSIHMLNPKTLTSGLDDYPRASNPSPDEYHIDLRCWMALASRTLSKISFILNDTSNAISLKKLSDSLHDNENLDRLHWDNDNKMYCDFGYSTERSELKMVKKVHKRPDGRLETHQSMERISSGPLTYGCVAEFGYVSLFPMLLKVIDANNDKLGTILDRLLDEQELWSPCGIRSLSKLSRYYNKYNTEHDKPYWRGPIWININYMVLDSLQHYSRIDGPYKQRCKEIFLKLKSNLVNNVLNQYDSTGYLWENYNDKTCAGQGSHPFTGWTSLILLVMSSKI